MSYTPPLDVKSLLKATKIYRWFTLTVLIFTLILSIFIFVKPNFWTGKILVTIGSWFIFVSVVSTRYFSILKNANKYNRQVKLLNKDSKEESSVRSWLCFEKWVNYLWILGYILLISSQWIDI